MTYRRARLAGAILAMGLCSFAVAAAAQEASAPRVTVHYSVTPKAGEGDAFIAATKAHAAWHREHQDPWSWNVYSVEFGPDPGRLHIRSAAHTMAEIGAYQASDFARADSAHYQKTVMPHVAAVDAHIARMDPQISALTGDPESWRLFELVHLQLRYGQSASWRAAIVRIHDALQQKQWPHPYLFSWLESGGPTPMVTLVLPRADWAGLDIRANPQAVVAEVLGEDEAVALWKQSGDAVTSAMTEIVRFRPELSVKAAK